MEQMDKVDAVSRKYGLEITMTKDKAMAIAIQKEITIGQRTGTRGNIQVLGCNYCRKW